MLRAELYRVLTLVKGRFYEWSAAEKKLVKTNVDYFIDGAPREGTLRKGFLRPPR